MQLRPDTYVTRGFPFFSLSWFVENGVLFNHISSDNNDCWRPNFPLVWPHGPGSQKKTVLVFDPRVYFSTELRWPGLHSWRWGHGGDVDVLVGDVFVFKVLSFDVFWCMMMCLKIGCDWEMLLLWHHSVPCIDLNLQTARTAGYSRYSASSQRRKAQCTRLGQNCLVEFILF